ncbi:MAG: hypothetical protein LUH45_04575 [Clostridiales bacterium]|nr:hypothetical protein [Clostridiales bacterium]
MLLCLSATAFATESGFDLPEAAIPQEVLEVAQDGVSWVGDKVASDSEKWGISSNVTAGDFTLGQGFPVHYITSDTVEQAAGDSLAELVDASLTEEWVFTLDTGGTAVLFLTVGYEDGDCIVTGWGGDAQAYGELRDQLLSNGSKAALFSFDGYYYFVSETAGEVTVVAVDSQDQENLAAYAAENADVSVADFTTALKTTVAWNQSQGSEVLDGAGGIRPPKEVAQQQSGTHWTVYLLGGAVLVGCIGWVLYRKQHSQR